MNPTPALQNSLQTNLQEVAALLRYEQMLQLEMASFRRSDSGAERNGLCRGTAKKSIAHFNGQRTLTGVDMNANLSSDEPLPSNPACVIIQGCFQGVLVTRIGDMTNGQQRVRVVDLPGVYLEIPGKIVVSAASSMDQLTGRIRSFLNK